MKIVEKKISYKEKLKRGHFLYFGYYYLYTKIMDFIIAKRSMEGFVCNSGDEVFPVQSASYRILKKTVPEINIGEDDVFVDVGCGLGRLMGYFFLKSKMGKINYGVEINNEAARFSKHIFANKKNVKILCGDATRLTLKDASVFVMYNPFGKTILEKFLNHLETYAREGIKIYYLHAEYEQVFQERKNNWKCNKRVIIQPKYHVPVVLCEYEFKRG